MNSRYTQIVMSKEGEEDITTEVDDGLILFMGQVSVVLELWRLLECNGQKASEERVTREVKATLGKKEWVNTDWGTKWPLLLKVAKLLK